MPRVAKALGRSGSTIAAVAYLTYDHLGLGEGDTIVVNASPEAVEAGATSPRLLLELMERGVDVAVCPNLHAKTIVRGNKVAVGSANLSVRTMKLHEVMLVSNDEVLARRMRRYIEGLVSAGRITQNRLEELAALYPSRREPGHEPSGQPRGGELFDPRSVGTVWLYRGSRTDFEPRGLAATAPTQVDATGLDGRDWELIERNTAAKFGDVFVSFDTRWMRPPMRYLAKGPLERRDPGTQWALVGFRTSHRSCPTSRAPQDLIDKANRAELGLRVPKSRVSELLSLWN